MRFHNGVHSCAATLMIPFASWPRWLRAGAYVLLLSAVLAAFMGLDLLTAPADPAPRSALAQSFQRAPHQWLDKPVNVSVLERDLAARQILAVGVDGRRVLVTRRDGTHYSTELLATDGGLGGRLESLSRAQAFDLTAVRIDPRGATTRWADRAVTAAERTLILALVLGVVVFLVQRARQGGSLMGAVEPVSPPNVRFEDVVGASEAKAALQQVAAFMRAPDKYLALGARPPRGVLLEGPPGTGKTLLARALAGECGAHFIAVDGSHFSSMFYGAGISKVRELFASARRNAPCIVFIDEFDGIGQRSTGSAGPGHGSGTPEENRIINKLLVELDGFDAMENVVVIGATNHADNIDPALKRPGRFDLVARVTLPTLPDRLALLQRCVSRIRAAQGLDLDTLARSMAGMSHADIEGVVNRGTVMAAERDAPCVTQEHLHRALERHQLGGEVSALKGLMVADDRRRIAVHEAGHALVAHALNAGVVERVTIEPRGHALGVTFMTRANELPLFGQSELAARLGMMLAGREAELLVLGQTSSGAADDLKRASALAVDMVSTMGFSERFGLLSLAGVPPGLVGPHIQERVLEEARQILEAAQACCRDVLVARRAALDALTDTLLACETVSGEPLTALLNAGGTQVTLPAPEPTA